MSGCSGNVAIPLAAESGHNRKVSRGSTPEAIKPASQNANSGDSDGA